MKKSWLVIALWCLAPLVLGVSCQNSDTFKNGSDVLGAIKLGPFPRQSALVGGYNLYMCETFKGTYEKINTEPVEGNTSIMVPYLKPGTIYYFYMTSVGHKDPGKESRPSRIFARTAKQSWN